MSEMPTCPIVSAFSEVKSATGYPKCIRNECAWWIGDKCAIAALGRAIEQLSMESYTFQSIANELKLMAGAMSSVQTTFDNDVSAIRRTLEEL